MGVSGGTAGLKGKQLPEGESVDQPVRSLTGECLNVVGGEGKDSPVKQSEDRPKNGFSEVDISQGFIPSACARDGKKIAAGQGYCRRCH